MQRREEQNKENIKQKGAEERGERNCQREERRRRRQRVYFLAHCWELFFTFYLAVRLVWPKIRVDFFLPCTWASEKLSHGWQSIIFFSSTWVFSNVGPQFAVKLCFFFTWASHFRQNWKPLFCFHAFGPFISSLQNSQNHMVLPWLYLLSWANLCPMGYQQIYVLQNIGLGAWVGAAMVAFSIKM